ncbi:MAG: hypothetical protein LC650_01065 [Actinobacteria bacterium]|nr:hypothetical protein [Actinomycetota bacterium]
MGVLGSLADINKAIDSRPKGFESVRDRNLTQVMKTGEKRKIRFLQELDPQMKNYDEKFGHGLVVSEYEHPDHFWFLLVDTTDEEGECWAAAQNWKSKLNLYVNVLDVESGKVFYIARSALGGLGADIIESANERGTITDAVWSLKKTGEGLGTRYALTLVDLTSAEIDVDPADLIDFRESVLNEVPSDQQEKAVAELEERLKAKAKDSGTDSDDDDEVW